MSPVGNLFHRIGAGAARRMFGTITRVAVNDSVAALTFDDGPHERFTPELLDLLERHKARATFFLLGEHAARHPDILRRMARAGHALANHSWDHPSFPLIGSPERRRQVRACAEAIAPFGERLFRPPYGEQSLASRIDLYLLGYRVVMCDCEVGDWYDKDAHKMARALASAARPGSIICLHDAVRSHPSKEKVPKHRLPPNADRSAMLEALETFLENMRGKMRFITVPQLLRHGRPQWSNWYRVTEPGGYEGPLSVFEGGPV